MTAPVTSKYYTRYWVVLFVFPIVVIGFVIFLGYNAFVNGVDHTTLEMLCILPFLIGLSIGYLVKFLQSTPRKIIVTVENITVDQYLFPKHTVIYYTDIDSSRTVKPVPNGKSPEFKSLILELHNGTSFRIEEADFVNYGEMKQAIYDHLFRGK